ncbi:MAG: single-stranded DNA-binding protein [Blastocatellia bacterium]|nr:single-stranded DNA-binding protein [Blastocatellia bacterium]
MASFNKIIIVGYLGRDPELRYTPQGTAVCNFSVATTERRKDKAGEYQDVTTWFSVSLWGNRAEQTSQYLSKGKLVYLEGRLTQREYQDRDGNTRTSLDVNASDLQFIGPRSDDTSGFREEGPARSESPEARPAAEDVTDTISDDDIPF